MTDRAEGEMLNHENEMMAKFKAEREAEQAARGKSKQIIVMRTDLNMRKGKMIAQGSHASMSWLSNRVKHNADFEYESIALCEEEEVWLNGQFTKICVQVKSEAELQEIFDNARKAGLTAFLITDAGHTEFGGVPTKTCCAIGPNWSSEIDPITKHLPLL
jgi:PTH2 family peptidyl-tRNA hydrolase